MPAWLQKLVIANQPATGTGNSLSKVVHYKLDYSTGYMCGHYANVMKLILKWSNHD